AKVRSVRIINAQGRMLSAERIGDDNQAVVNVSDLPSGFYVVEVETEEGGKMLRKFVRR
ncbi:MAG: T9SS type A sorting domain-containing protein, partial [Lewinellaceae bacterium]|nr:T9SS type A sorting domain-containing protein [Lewinellaceae bacterium]